MSGRPFWLAAAVLLAAGGVALVDYLRDSPQSTGLQTKALDPEALRPGFGPRSYQGALAAAERDLAGKRTLLAREPNDWLRMEGVARALLARARLTADAANLLEANRILARGIASAPWPAGPTLSRAGAALSIHDLPGAEAALARFDASVIAPPRLEAFEARSMRCEIAFERGRLAEARRLCGEGDGDPGRALRLANIALASGEPSRAAAMVEQTLALPRQSPHQLASIMLQRAAVALSTGDWTASGRWARAADRVFPGYWLAEAFAAQNRALEGDKAGAEAAYRSIAARTGNPDVYGALATLASARGDRAAMARYLAAARKGWDARTALLPETYASHFAEHLALSGEVERALPIAAADYGRRPYLQPLTDYVFVLEKAGQHARVVEMVERGEKAGFRSATLSLAKSSALRRMGQLVAAEEARLAAVRMNPRIEDPRQAFVHFRQD